MIASTLAQIPQNNLIFWGAVILTSMKLSLKLSLKCRKSFWHCPWWLSGKESSCQCRRQGFDPWLTKIPWRRKWQSTPEFLPGGSHGQRSLVGYNPWGQKRVGHDLATKQPLHSALRRGRDESRSGQRQKWRFNVVSVESLSWPREELWSCTDPSEYPVLVYKSFALSCPRYRV